MQKGILAASLTCIVRAEDLPTFGEIHMEGLELLQNGGRQLTRRGLHRLSARPISKRQRSELAELGWIFFKFCRVVVPTRFRRSAHLDWWGKV